MLRSFVSRTPAHTATLARLGLIAFEPDTGTNPAGGQGGQGDNQDDRQNLQGLLQRHNNDAMAVIATLLSENHGLRDERRQLRGQLPAQGAMVLSGDQATQWQSYQQLGAVADLQTALKDRDSAQGELANLRRDALIRDVAEVAGYKASVLGKLPGADKLAFEVRATEKDGKPVKSVVIKEGDKETPLADYAKAQWADFLPALTAGQSQQPAGTSFVQQSAGGTAAASPLDDYAKRFQEQRDKAANPLAPAATRTPLA